MEVKARIIVKEMLNSREYHTICDDGKDIVAIKPDGNEIRVVFVEKLAIDEIRTQIRNAEEKDLQHIIIIHHKDPTPNVETTINQEAEKGTIIELFEISTMQFNITKHELIPKHVKCDEAETKDVISKLGHKLPTLLKTDPVARFYRFTVGSIIKVYRKDAICYRIVR